MTPPGTKRPEQLREEIIRLGPWHLDVEVTPEVSTRASLDAPPGAYPDDFGGVSFLSARTGFVKLLRRVYPDGLDGRTVLDCACNCGAYLFWARELGAGECLGFDVREHWIDQARFLASDRAKDSRGIRFEVCDLYDLGRLGSQTFDIVLFKGIFYHLPDPVTGLRLAADRAEELLLVNTATRNGLPDGLLSLSEESADQLMSGVYGLNWLPTGPSVLDRTLRWMGFAETRLHWWTQDGGQNPHLGRLEMLAAREPEFFEQFDAAPQELSAVEDSE